MLRHVVVSTGGGRIMAVYPIAIIWADRAPIDAEFLAEARKAVVEDGLVTAELSEQLTYALVGDADVPAQLEGPPATFRGHSQPDRASAGAQLDEDEAAVALMADVQKFLLGHKPAVRAAAMQAVFSSVLMMACRDLSEFDRLLADAASDMRADARRDWPILQKARRDGRATKVNGH
jgi:hypothetical protein